MQWHWSSQLRKSHALYIDMASLTVVMASRNHGVCECDTSIDYDQRWPRRSSAIWVSRAWRWASESFAVATDLLIIWLCALWPLFTGRSCIRQNSPSDFAVAAGKSSMAVAPSLSLLLSLATTLVSLVSARTMRRRIARSLGVMDRWLDLGTSYTFAVSICIANVYSSIVTYCNTIFKNEGSVRFHMIRII